MAHYRWIPEEKKWIELDEIYKDPNSGLNGPVYCPEGGYFDKAIQRRFETKNEKRAFMKENGLMMEADNKVHKGEGGIAGKRYYFYAGQKNYNRNYRYR